MYCADCGKKWSGGNAPGIGPVCECGSDDFISRKVLDRLVELSEFVVDYGTTEGNDPEDLLWCIGCKGYIDPNDKKRPNNGHRDACTVELAQRLLREKCERMLVKYGQTKITMSKHPKEK